MISKGLFFGTVLSAATLAAEPKLALLGSFADEKSLEQMVASEAVAAHNASSPTAQLKLTVFNTGNTVAGSVDAAKKAVGDADVMAVVLHGEAAADASVLAVFAQAGVAVVAATSWAQPRVAEAGPTWLIPSQAELVNTAATYARKEAKMGQVAVLDNGAPTSVAAAKFFASRFRSLGGKVPFEGTFNGDPAQLPATLLGLSTHWPQMVFYAGEGGPAGELIAAMKDEKSLKNADLIGLPPLFEPAFFAAARLKSSRTRGVFPCPDFGGQTPLLRMVGLTFPKTSPQYKAYFRAFRKPGRWTSLVFDGVALAAQAVNNAAKAPMAVAASASAVSPVAQEADAPELTRESVRFALLAIDSHRGIRGLVKFGPSREPVDPKSMVYFAQNKVNKKEMLWLFKAYGPPF